MTEYAGNAGISRELHIAQLNARVDRLPVWGLSKILFAVVGASYFFCFFDITVIGGTLPVVAKQFHLTTGQLALPVTANLFAYIIGAYALATVADYIGRRNAFAISVAMLVAGGILTALSWNYASFVGFRFLTGLGMGSQISLAATIMTELSPSRMRGRSIAFNVFWGACGLGAAPWIVIGLLTLGPVGWRLSFAVGALVVLFAVFLNDRWIPESPRWLVLHGKGARADRLVEKMEQTCRKRGHELTPVPEVSTEDLLEKFPTAELLRPPYLSRVLVVFFFWFFSYMAVYAYLAYEPLLLGGLHVPGAPKGLLLSAIGDISFPVGGILAALLIDKWDRKYLAACAGAVGLIGMLLLIFAHQPVTVMIGAFVTGIWVLSPAYGYAYTAEVFPTRARASGMAIGDGLGHLGGAVQPYIVVAALAAFAASSRFTLWMLAAMIAAAICVILFAGIRTTGAHLTELTAQRKQKTADRAVVASDET